ncbi:helix-turn-helix transcriptional regulator [Microbacterium marinilacus]|uniref:Helix-turn-helix transcriptional regulator n=1 Tax=Microbacterium marinilacus TaxID=415209 RepID=A0ABP7BQV4_9MICO|nr:helix-turn-helix transcriptional regulator [Microbacterium marinilacus]MBY0687709.1 helix-turn-helix transcriptional regulator [Microbacterium marinilacus]
MEDPGSGHGGFGRAVRHWRDRVAPEAVGVPVGGRRRAAGLRREEVAGLAGISVDYLTRLEQGRAASPSAQVVEALARVLRLSDAERELLYRLAGQAPPGRGTVPARIAPSVLRLLDRFEGIPVAVYDGLWDLVIANAPYDALMGATTTWQGLERNALWRNLLGPRGRVVHTEQDRDDLVTGLVADLRLTAARYPGDPRVARLVSRLRAQSPRFVELWGSDELPQRDDPTRRKVIEHPDVGPIALDCDTLVVAGDDLRLMVYTAEPGSEDADRLSLAVVLGTQRLVGPAAGRKA